MVTTCFNQRKFQMTCTYFIHKYFCSDCTKMFLLCTWNILENIRKTCKCNTDTQNGDHVLQPKKVPDDTYIFNSEIFLLSLDQMFLSCTWNILECTMIINKTIWTRKLPRYFTFATKWRLRSRLL